MKHPNKLSLLAVALTLGLGLTAQAATFSVNTTDDTHDATPGDGTCADASGNCSFRAAFEEIGEIEASGESDEENSITFAVDGTFELNSDFAPPTLVGPLTITGNGPSATIIDGNYGTYGNGISASANLNLSNIQFTELQVSSLASLTFDQVDYNEAPIAYTAFTGSGSLVATNSSFSYSSGQPINNSGTATLTNVKIEQSTSPDGGAIYNSGTLTLRDCSLTSNTSTDASRGGGAIQNRGGTAYIINSTIAGNSSYGPGGGIANHSGGTVKLYNSTVNANTSDSDNDLAGSGGGIYTDTSSTTYITNSILSFNTDNSGAGRNCYGPTESGDYNIITSTVGCTITGTTTNNITASPKYLGSLGDHGGNTDTLALQPTSPAIDHGNPAGCLDHNGNEITSDQRGAGYTRPVDGDGNGSAYCDIGSFESITTETSCSDDEDNDNDSDIDCADSDCSADCADGDGDGSSAQDDCDDENALAYPGATEVCNTFDDDCDGENNEGLATTTYYIDSDEDGYGGETSAIACTGYFESTAFTDPIDAFVASHSVTTGGDCDDDEAATYPGATEICADGDDNDCDGSDVACSATSDDPDGDTIVGAEDLCPDTFDTENEDNDRDGIGDSCDPDDNSNDDLDNDGIVDTEDDSDGDGILDSEDSTPVAIVANSDDADSAAASAGGSETGADGNTTDETTDTQNNDDNLAATEDQGPTLSPASDAGNSGAAASGGGCSLNMSR